MTDTMISLLAKAKGKSIPSFEPTPVTYAASDVSKAAEVLKRLLPNGK